MSLLSDSVECCEPSQLRLSVEGPLERPRIVALEVPGELIYRELVTRFVALSWSASARGRSSQHEVAEDFMHGLVTVVGEAFNNVVLHAYAGAEPGNVKIVMTFDVHEIVIDVFDFGSDFNFNPDAVSPPDFDALPESGLGLHLIRSFTDRLDYFPGRPNRLRMIKKVLPGSG